MARDMWVILEQISWDQIPFWNREWKNKIFIFFGVLHEYYENIRSKILNSGDLTSIEEIYFMVEAEEQRQFVMTDAKNVERSALINRGV